MNTPELPDWIHNFNGALTVTDALLNIVYMNEKAKKTWEAHGDLIGKNLADCHQARSMEIMRRILSEGGTNSYTIEKKGIKKLIYQEAWKKPDGSVGGLLELSLEIPFAMPHFVRS